MRGVDSIGKIKPYMFFFLFEKSRKGGQALLSRFGLFLPFLRGGLEMWSGHFNFRSFFVFCFLVFLFFGFLVFCPFSKDRRVLLLRRLLPQVPLTYLGLLLREYIRREMFDSNKLSSRLRWEIVLFLYTRYLTGGRSGGVSVFT